MNAQATVQKQAIKPMFTPVVHGLLQRCTATTECDECRKKRESMLQRAAVDASPVNEVPPIVHEVLRSPGQPLDAQTRAFMEPRFGHDFSNVRLHTDVKAVESARAVKALAYTVGPNVVFGIDQNTLKTVKGRQLLAHELTHVIQQSNTQSQISSGLKISCSGDHSEREAKQVIENFDVMGDASHSKQSPTVTPTSLTLARGEKWDAFWDVGPFDAMKAKELADKSLRAAERTGLPGLRNGPADAWRHCYWNCLMTGEIGRDQAKTIADNHEKHGGGPAIENLMDSRNNWEGRECDGSNCDSCCQTKLDTGVLDVIESGKMVPSKKSSRTGGKQSDKYEY